MNDRSAGQVLGACLLGLLLGLMQPLGLAMSMMLVIGTVATAALYAWCGLMPALVHLAASAVSVGFFYGAPTAAAALAVIAVPSGAVIALMRRGAPFFTRLKAAIGAQTLVFAALVALLYAVYRRDLADVAVEALNGLTREMHPLIRLETLRRIAQVGLYFDAETTARILNTPLSDSEQLELLQVVFQTFGDALRLGLPSMLVSSGILTGALTALWSARIAARRGDAVEYVPIDGWFVPHRVFYGALAALGTALVFYLMRLNGAESVWLVARTAVSVMLQLAGAAALARSMKASGRGPGLRVGLLAAGLAFAPGFMALAGLFSLLMGRKGVISGYIAKKKKEHGEDDDL